MKSSESRTAIWAARPISALVLPEIEKINSINLLMIFVEMVFFVTKIVLTYCEKKMF